jgi:hypothetical protein
MSELWQITGTRHGRTFSVKVRARSYNEAVRLGSTTHMLVVRDCVLLDAPSPESLLAQCIAARHLLDTPHELGPDPAAEPTLAPDATRPDGAVKRNRKRIYTDEALARIPAMLEQGLSREQIAAQLGGKVNSLQVVCSRKGISLWRRDRRRLPAVEPDADLTLQIKAQTLTQLQKRAEATGTSETKLASRLLDLIAKEDLYDAVLDEAVT